MLCMYSEAATVPLKKKRHQRVLQESSRRCTDTRKREKTTKIKSPRGAAQILRSGKSTAKKKHHRRVLEALRRYSEVGKDDQNKESLRSAEKILESEESTAKTKKTV